MFRYALANCRVLYDLTHNIQTEQRKFFEEALRGAYQQKLNRQKKRERDAKNARQQRWRAKRSRKD